MNNLKRVFATPCASFVGNENGPTHLEKLSDTVSMNQFPVVDIGDIGPTKSIPIWCHGLWTGTGWSSGLEVITLFFAR
jgi:thiamine monophosphate synthase